VRFCRLASGTFTVIHGNRGVKDVKQEVNLPKDLAKTVIYGKIGSWKLA
jgi:hypothetical protein